MARLAVCALAVLLLVVGTCFCRPRDDNAAGTSGRNDATGAAPTDGKPTGVRTSRLQKPTQVLNSGFDEIVVESNLQVHNRVGSKNKSKITLPSNSTATAASTNKAARSLLV